MKEVCVIGLGYIGLPTAAMLASHGIQVKGVDVVPDIVDTINRGEVHIQEPDLKELVKKVVSEGKLKASLRVEACEAFIIAVPTPITDEKEVDLSHVKAAARQIYPVLKKGNLVVLESTVPPKTTEEVLVPILEKSGLQAGVDFYVAHCPERVLPGRILYELENNNKVIGGINRISAEKGRDLYRVFVKGQLFITDASTAEMCKLMENTYRDVNIALANELARICEGIGINAWDVIKHANKHPRVDLHKPGPGVGGHCLAVDPWFIIKAQPGISRMIKMARQINDSMPRYVFEKIKGLVAPGEKIVILGYTYKADVDDIRESPIEALVEILRVESLYTVEIVDPYRREFDKDIYEAARDSSLILLGVNHRQFQDIRFDLLAKVMKNKVILDTRNDIQREKAAEFGFRYYLLGDGRGGWQ
jgi:UDP-N-acetyl-D-mannosaminuronic acid dehydrogenase